MPSVLAITTVQGGLHPQTPPGSSRANFHHLDYNVLNYFVAYKDRNKDLPEMIPYLCLQERNLMPGICVGLAEAQS